MSTTRIILSTLVTLFGISIFVYGGYDDSPGAQGLGLGIVILSIFGTIRTKKKSSN